jgi:tetratricopeptide (TPR) repeat protein
MKTFFINSFLVFIISTQSLAQDCSSAKDCLEKGKTVGFESKAFEFYEKALKLAKKENSNPSDIYFQRGVQYYKQYTANFKEAEKDFKSAIKEDDKNIWAYLWLSNVYAYGDKDFDKANKYLTDLLVKFPSDPRVLRERANLNRQNKKLSLAATDYEMAYNLILDDASMVDEGTAAEIVRWHAELHMRSKKIIVADEQALKILEDGLKVAPNNAKLLGDLALAYYDVNNKDKAFELGAKAHAIDKSNVGSLFVAMKALEAKEYYTAATLMWEADRALMHSHPLVYYYFSSAQWAYCYNVAKNQWENNVGIIKNRLELATEHGTGTVYDWYAQDAKRLRDSLN